VQEIDGQSGREGRAEGPRRSPRQSVDAAPAVAVMVLTIFAACCAQAVGPGPAGVGGAGGSGGGASGASGGSGGGAPGPSPAAAASDGSGWRGVQLEDETGPIPPPHAWESTLRLTLRPAERQVDCRYRRTYLYREGMSAEELKAEGASPDDDVRQALQLGGGWYDEFAGLLAGLRTCPAATPGRGPGVGGGGRRFRLLGEGDRQQVVALGEREAARAGDPVLCPPQGESWELLLGDAVRAALQEAGKDVVRRVRFLRLEQDGRGWLTQLELDHRQRQVAVLLLHVAKDGVATPPEQASPFAALGPAELRRLLALLSGPVYYAAGEVRDRPTAAGEYLDRGRGSYYSLATGLKDPVGKSGTVAALRSFLLGLTAEETPGGGRP